MSGVQQLVRNVRDALARRGTDNIWALGRAFRIADDDRSGFLTYPEFTKSLREVGIDLPDTQARQLFSAFDRTGNGQVEYDEFLQQIRGRMNSARLAVVAKAFAKLDHMKRGVVTVDDIAQLYNARAHPEVKQGKSTEDMVFRRFLEQFDTVTQDGQVHLNEFEEYYQNVSASIDRDDYFIELVTNAWQLNRGAVAGAAAQATATSPYKATIRPPFATDIPQTPAAQATRGSRGMPTTAATAQQAATPPWNADVQQVGAAQPGVRNVDQTVELLRNVLAARGVRGIFSLGKLFRIVDNDNSRDLTQAEFSQAMREFRVGLTDVEVGKLFQAFDRNQSGTIDYNEFLRALRGPLPPIRKAIINRAFRSMDTSGNGTIDMSDLRGVYTPRLHPDVRAGKRTEDDVLLEFLDTFGAAGGREITSEQFEEYYANVSASIDDDKYFELMMTNAWRLSDAPVQQRSPQQSQQLRTTGYQARASGPPAPPAAPLSLVDLQNKMRQILARRGADTMAGIGKSFRIIDDNRSGGLQPDEFTKAMRQYGIALSEQEVAALFAYYDTDGTNTIDYEEFLRGLRGSMNANRRAAVQALFRRLDRTGRGVITVDDIMAQYNARENPEVKRGRMSEAQAMRQFLDVFDVGGQRDGQVTPQEWENYYEAVSASVDDDRHFLLILNQAWTPRKMAAGVRMDI